MGAAVQDRPQPVFRSDRRIPTRTRQCHPPGPPVDPRRRRWRPHNPSQRHASKHSDSSHQPRCGWTLLRCPRRTCAKPDSRRQSCRERPTGRWRLAWRPVAQQPQRQDRHLAMARREGPTPLLRPEEGPPTLTNVPAPAGSRGPIARRGEGHHRRDRSRHTTGIAQSLSLRAPRHWVRSLPKTRAGSPLGGCSETASETPCRWWQHEGPASERRGLRGTVGL